MAIPWLIMGSIADIDHRSLNSPRKLDNYNYCQFGQFPHSNFRSRFDYWSIESHRTSNLSSWLNFICYLRQDCVPNTAHNSNYIELQCKQSVGFSSLTLRTSFDSFFLKFCRCWRLNCLHEIYRERLILHFQSQNNFHSSACNSNHCCNYCCKTCHSSHSCNNVWCNCHNLKRSICITSEWSSKYDHSWNFYEYKKCVWMQSESSYKKASLRNQS